jgi:homopolymeric O-antigen transport system permease protein
VIGARTAGMVEETWQHRGLVLSFVRRQYQLRYRQSLVGFAWVIVPPIASLVVATLVFDKVIGVDTGNVPYPLFALAGLVPWSFFATSVTTGVPSIVMQQTMITRLAFPRSSVPLSAVGTALLDLGVTSIVFVVYVFVTGAGLPLTALLAPLLLMIELVFVLGVVFFGSALNVFARDIRLAVPLIVQLWLFLTPVMYPLSEVPANLRPLYLANPMTGLIESFRQILIAGEAPDPSLLAPSIIGAAAALVIGGWYFAVTNSRFADVI